MRPMDRPDDASRGETTADGQTGSNKLRLKMLEADIDVVGGSWRRVRSLTAFPLMLPIAESIWMACF